MKKNTKKKNRIIHVLKKHMHNNLKTEKIYIQKKDNYKEDLMQVNKQEEEYDKLFEKKLADQYKEFKDLKEFRLQSKRFARILIVLFTIVVLALLLLTFS